GVIRMQMFTLYVYPLPAPCSASPRRDPPIPEPDTFDGSVDKCRGFLLQCRRVFDQTAEQAFQTLKNRFTTAPVLLQPTPHGSSWLRWTLPTLGWERSFLSGPGKTTSCTPVPTTPDG
uniref:Uncharacterized protein n=1 Tax=Monopterus albus TaxID=43700 RepID=A0A3Q3JV67_MONAL